MPMLGRDPKPSDPEQSENKDQPDHLIDPALRDNDLPPPPIEQEKEQPAVATTDSDPKSMRQPLHMSSPFVSAAHSSDARLFNVTTFDRHHRTYSNRPPSPPPPIATMSNSPSPSVVSVDRSTNSTPHMRRSPPNIQQQSNMYPPPPPPPSYDQRHHYSQRPDPIPYSYPHQPFEQQQRYPLHPDTHPPYHTQSYFSVPTMAHQPPPPQMRDNYGRQYPPISQTPVTIVHTDDAATKLTDGIRRRCFNCCTTDTSTWRRSNLSPGKVLCNKCGLFERTHSRPRPDQFPHKRGPLAVSVSRGRTPPGNQLPPISNPPGPYQYHHSQLTPLNAGEYHHQNSLPALQTWQNNSGNSSNNPNNGSSSQQHNGSTNNHGVSPTEQANSNSNGVGGSGGNGAGSSTNIAPLLLPRRPTVDSPRMSASASSTPRSVRPFDEPLSSNVAAILGGSAPAAAATATGTAGDSSRPHSQPPTPPSRSSTVHPSTASVKANDGGGSSAGHSPPPVNATVTASATTGSSARDQA